MRRKCKEKNRALQRRRLHQGDKELRSSKTSTQRHEHVPSLTLTLQESQDVLLPYGTLHVPDDCPARVVHELDADLRHTTTRTSAAEDLADVEHDNNRDCGSKGGAPS